MEYADNKTYKDMYHFKRNPYRPYNTDKSSLDLDAEINGTIKENKERANVEIEKGEIVLNPDLSALFHARGKKHYNGGINVNLKPDSFIFSDDKTLAFNKKDHELFELKEGGKQSAIKNTPAQVLKRNINVKHYNKMVHNLDDKNKDSIAKRSSTLMLDKYVQTLGNIAYVQEAKKDFPTGLPEFSSGTAPVYDEELKDDIMQQKQYAKYGGTINNPYMQRGGRQTKALNRNWGLWEGDVLPDFQKKFGVSNAADKISGLTALARTLGYNGEMDNEAFQKWLYSTPENQQVIDKWHNKYGQPPINGAPKNMFDGKIGIRWQNALNEIANRPTVNPTLRSPNLKIGDIPHNPVPQEQQPQDNVPQVPDIDVTPQGIKTADWNFTPWQRVSHGYNALKYATAKRYMPMRSHLNASYADAQLVNPEQAVGDARAMANSQIGALGSMNPIMRNAQAAAISGQVLNQVPGIRSQYDNQNAQITNQFRQYNNQIRNNQSAVNMQNDQQYHQQSIAGRANFDNMKSFLGDQYMNNVLRDVESNQSLAYNMMTMQNPAYGFNFRTGDFYRNPVNIMDIPSNTSGDTVDAMMQQVQDMKSKGMSDTVISAFLRTKAFSQMAPYLGQAPTFGQLTGKKKGGKFNPYK